MIDRKIYEKLNERIKELKCIYAVEESLTNQRYDMQALFLNLLDIIPSGWQHPTACEAFIRFEEKEFFHPGFQKTDWFQKADLVVDNSIVGEVAVYYQQKIDKESSLLFLPEEQKLLNSIADRLSHYIFFQRLKSTIDYLQQPMKKPAREVKLLTTDSDIHWKWRYHMAELIAEKIDMDRFGVKAVYLIGSTRTAEASVTSDIDMLVHHSGTADQAKELQVWMEGWGLCLAEINYLKTGYRTSGGLIDLHLVTDEDVRKKSSFAVMIDPQVMTAHCLRKR